MPEKIFEASAELAAAQGDVEADAVWGAFTAAGVATICGALQVRFILAWSKISNALKRLGFRSRNFLLKSMYNSGSTIKFREALE